MTGNDRLLELLSEQMERTLDGDERDELVRLLGDAGETPDAFERAAGAICLAEVGAQGLLASEAEGASLPAGLLDKLESQAQEQMVEGITAPRPFEDGGLPVLPKLSIAAAVPPAANDAPRTMSSLFAFGGWAAAAAAILALALTRDGEPTTAAQGSGELASSDRDAAVCPACPELPAPSPVEVPVEPKASELREALQQADPKALRLAWANTKDPLAGAATGDVVWSNAKQEGYMRFSGLPKNDPTKQQYQLWIFDKDRSDKTPVDGGVFEIGRASCRERV